MLRVQTFELLSSSMETFSLFSASSMSSDFYVSNKSNHDEHVHYKYPQNQEMESTYRTILVSYLIRSIDTALIYQTCVLLRELSSVPVFVPEQSEMHSRAAAQGLLRTRSQTVRYHDLVVLWD